MARTWKIESKDSDKPLRHYGVKGMAWGYTDGVRNGKRTAEEDLEAMKKGLQGAAQAGFVETEPGVKKNARGDKIVTKKGNSLIGGKRSSSGKNGRKTVTYEEGALDSAVKKGKKWLKGLFD